MTKLLYLDDLKIGLQLESPTFTVTEGDVRRFALAFDPQPFHLDESEAKRSIFGGLAASGWHTAAITMRLLTPGGLPLAGGIIGMSVQITWLKPVHPGDVLRVVSTVRDIKRSKSKRQCGDGDFGDARQIR
ncbi:MaoC/PaaZ C-terminal domain-containing protein [Caballeronia zhejiangensis]|uniref:MaoC/PaaZ C-terminal domain-containing protein n=1 Tax=Caballeronia zhejiangensis TaxID=871203 RepID=UPI0027E0151E|nr:MaoC/PaaZ C-terminal domain-containing protein [Caballeronia zhejiangensis]